MMSRLRGTDILIYTVYFFFSKKKKNCFLAFCNILDFFLDISQFFLGLQKNFRCNGHELWCNALSYLFSESTAMTDDIVIVIHAHVPRCGVWFKSDLSRVYASLVTRITLNASHTSDWTMGHFMEALPRGSYKKVSVIQRHWLETH